MRFNSRLSKLPNAIKAIFFFLVLLIVGFTAYYVKADHITLKLFIAGIGIGFFLYVTLPIWMPNKRSPKWYRIMAITFLEVAAVSFGAWQPFLSGFLKDLVEKNRIPDFLKSTPIEQSHVLLMPILISIFWAINKFQRDTSGIGVNSVPIKADIIELDYEEQVRNVCASLEEDLRSIDIKTNWSSRLFVPMNAEVEIQRTNGKSKSISDLLSSIKNSRSRLFLVLGDPGSGKSVSLRTLCRDLLKKVNQTEKIPIYINLKEWSISEKWDEKNLPTVSQLNKFVFESLTSKDIILSRFFAKHYDRLYENGNLYFVLDSFDEIPAVLDERDNSELIKILSEVIMKFLSGARSLESQGILSSRIFRRPTSEFQANTTLEIRPLSEEKIIEMLCRSKFFSREGVHKIFSKRPDLIPIVRNPFMAQLLIEFVRNNPNRLPDNQSELFKVYVDNSLKSSSEKLLKLGLNKEIIISTTIEIASALFKEQRLEMKVNDLRMAIGNYPIEDTINILEFCKIGRFGAGQNAVFSFSHRRFCEYFAIQKIIKTNAPLDMETIPTDSQWRDAYVLYCEVADFESARRVANFCWDTIKTIDSPTDVRTIHSLRFLRDAFKGRTECVDGFNLDLHEFVLKQLVLDNHINTAKLSLECVNLLNEEQITQCIIKAMTLDNWWFEQTALKSCRYISHINEDLKEKLLAYVYDRNFISIILSYKKLKFTFGLSDSFRKIINALNFKLGYSIATLLLTVTLAIIFSSHYVLSFLLVSMIYAMVIVFKTIVSQETAIDKTTMAIVNTYDKYNFMYWPSKVIRRVFRKVYYGDMIEGLVQWKWSDTFRAAVLISMSYAAFKQTNLSKLETKIVGSPILLTICTLFAVAIFVNILSLFHSVKKKGFLALLKNYLIGFIQIALIYLPIHCFFKGLKLLPLQYQRMALAFLMVFSYLPIIIRTIVSTRSYFKHKPIYKKINFGQLSSREYLYNSYINLADSQYWQSKLVSYAEANIKDAKGQWPDENFLKISKDSNLIRLAKLEEKWLGLDR